MIKIVAEMSTENSTKENPTVPLVKIQDNNVSDPTSINALPITAILLAMVASCNSGKHVCYKLYVHPCVTITIVESASTSTLNPLTS